MAILLVSPILWLVLLVIEVSLALGSNRCPSIDGRNVDNYVNHVAANLVRLRVHWRRVRGNVDFRDHIKQERLFNA